MDMGRKPDPKSLTRKASAELRRLQAELDAIKQALAAQPAAQESSNYNEFVETACALIKAADDAAADRDYMLDSDDCIRVLRGEWKGEFLNDMPQRPAAQPAVPDAITDNSESTEYRTGWNDCRAEMLKGMK
jgi:hypothetical protein